MAAGGAALGDQAVLAYKNDVQIRWLHFSALAGLIHCKKPG